MATQTKGAGARAASNRGRPQGSRDPSPSERIRRRLPHIYDAVLKRAETGDALAARLCLDIVKHPENFPGADGKKP